MLLEALIAGTISYLSWIIGQGFCNIGIFEDRYCFCAHWPFELLIRIWNN